jgi:hypothetical protein
MSRRLVVAIAVTAGAVAAAAACDANLEVHYVALAADASGDAAGDVSAADAPPEDAAFERPPYDGGPAIPVDGNPSGEGGFCGCSATAGEGCCIPSGGNAPFCTPAGTACTAGGGVFILCLAYDPNTDSVCCWNDGVGPGGFTNYATLCGDRPQACTTTSDCQGQPCTVATCQGVTMGVCSATAPSCPR